VLQITHAERLALQLLAEGKGRRDLAASLLIAEDEVDERLRALFRRLGVETPVEAIAIGVKRGLIEYAVRDSQMGFGPTLF